MFILCYLAFCLYGFPYEQRPQISNGITNHFFSHLLRNSILHLDSPFIGASTIYFLCFFFFCSFWPHCSCPNVLVTSNTSPWACDLGSYAYVSGHVINENSLNKIFGTNHNFPTNLTHIVSNLMLLTRTGFVYQVILIFILVWLIIPLFTLFSITVGPHLIGPIGTEDFSPLSQGNLG